MAADAVHHCSGCMPPPCVSMREENSRTEALKNGHKGHQKRRPRSIIRQILKKTKISIFGLRRPAITFTYDAVSYSQNFDDGCHKEAEYEIHACRRRWFQDFGLAAPPFVNDADKIGSLSR